MGNCLLGSMALEKAMNKGLLWTGDGGSILTPLSDPLIIEIIIKKMHFSKAVPCLGPATDPIIKQS